MGMADVLIVLNTEIMSLTILNEMTAPRRMDVSMRRKEMMMKSAVLLEVQLKDVEARGALTTKNRLTKKMTTSQKKSTQVMYKLMTVPKDSFVLPFRTDFIS